MLIERGLVTRSGLGSGLDEQRLRGGRLGYNLLKLGRVTPAAFHLFLKDHLAVLAPELNESMRYTPAIDLLPARLAHHYGMLPARVEDGTLELAVATADRPALIPAVEQLTGLRVEPIVCPPSLIACALQRSYPDEVEPGILYRAVGDNLFVISDSRKAIRPLLPELVRADAPSVDWLRAIGAEAIRRGARRIHVEPRPEGARAVLSGAGLEGAPLSIPRGAYPGLARLLEGVSGMAARGRVVPREGRIGFLIDGRRIVASIRALPGLDGETFVLDLRERRIRPLARQELQIRLPSLQAALERLTLGRKGIILIAGPGPGEIAAGAEAILDLLDDALPVRAALGDWLSEARRGEEHPEEAMRSGVDGEVVPLEAILAHALEENPDLVLLPALRHAVDRRSLLDLARSQAMIAPVLTSDAFTACEWLVRSAHAREGLEGVVGILGVRLLERLCQGCRHPYDLNELLSPAPRHRKAGPGTYYVAQGCPSCRESGVLELEPVYEFLPGERILSFRPTVEAAAMRDLCALEGVPTMFHAALQEAAVGNIDVREPLRLLLHELS
jgi:type II secretory ATPase GspE/PulE/Tfp pilus assembly ATPase PilB-like protein